MLEKMMQERNGIADGEWKARDRFQIPGFEFYHEESLQCDAPFTSVFLRFNIDSRDKKKIKKLAFIPSTISSRSFVHFKSDICKMCPLHELLAGKGNDEH